MLINGVHAPFSYSEIPSDVKRMICVYCLQTLCSHQNFVQPYILFLVFIQIDWSMAVVTRNES